MPCRDWSPVIATTIHLHDVYPKEASVGFRCGCGTANTRAVESPADEEEKPSLAELPLPEPSADSED